MKQYNIYDVDPTELIETAAKELKSMPHLKAPEWATFAKTGHSKERAPVREDWWYVRAASILRKTYRYGPLGSNWLRRAYGGKKNRGHKKEHFYRGSGSIVRKILQQLEAAGLIAKTEKTAPRKGRIITGKGVALLTRAAKSLIEAAPKPAPVRPHVQDKPKEHVKEKPTDEHPAQHKDKPKAQEHHAEQQKPKAPEQPIAPKTPPEE